jgi:hypothetical protein
MPRSSTSSRFSSTSTKSHHKTPNVSIPPPPLPKMTYTNNFPQVQPNKSSFLGNVADGFSFGVGSSIARVAVDSIFKSSSQTTLSSPSTITPVQYNDKITKLYEECITKAANPDELSECEKYK